MHWNQVLARNLTEWIAKFRKCTFLKSFSDKWSLQTKGNEGRSQAGPKGHQLDVGARRPEELLGKPPLQNIVYLWN